MIIKFWGVRGSIPCPGPLTMKYGGNTPCIEVYFKQLKRRIIIDAGSGIRELGNHLVANELANGPIHTELFLTHTHWDHIMGFPFFTPIYIPTTALKVYGPVTYEDESLDKIVGGQLSYRYFPVREAELAANIEYIQLKEDRYDLGDGITLYTKYLNHPILCLGYRFEYQGKVFCTAFDTEPFRNLFCSNPEDPSYDPAMAEEGNIIATEQNTKVEEFFANADLLVHDTQYTEEEYLAAKIDWGHTPFEYAVASAKRAEVKRMALFHHDPVRTDAQLDELEKVYCNSDNPVTKIFLAREGMEIDL